MNDKKPPKTSESGAGSTGGKHAEPDKGAVEPEHKPGDAVREVPLGYPETPEQIKRRKKKAEEPDKMPKSQPSAQHDPSEDAAAAQTDDFPEEV
jgi:hypothetical protein